MTGTLDRLTLDLIEIVHCLNRLPHSPRDPRGRGAPTSGTIPLASISPKCSSKDSGSNTGPRDTITARSIGARAPGRFRASGTPQGTGWPRGEAMDRRPKSLRGLVDEVLDEPRNVLAAIASGGMGIGTTLRR